MKSVDTSCPYCGKYCWTLRGLDQHILKYHVDPYLEPDSDTYSGLFDTIKTILFVGMLFAVVPPLSAFLVGFLYAFIIIVVSLFLSLGG